jgi:hypothetical protein
MSESADGSGSEAAREAGAVDEVERNTKSQTQAASYTTTDHDVVRTWAEKRGAQPAMVRRTESDEGGVLRLEFRDGGSSGELDQVEWDEFFRVFDERNLAFLYQEQTSDGETSRFNKFVRRDG